MTKIERLFKDIIIYDKGIFVEAELTYITFQYRSRTRNISSSLVGSITFVRSPYSDENNDLYDFIQAKYVSQNTYAIQKGGK